MRSFDVFPIFKLGDFNALDVVSKTYELFLQGKGLKEFLVTKGREVSVTVDGEVFLPLLFNDENPFIRDERAIFYDEATDMVSIGYEVFE